MHGHTKTLSRPVGFWATTSHGSEACWCLAFLPSSMQGSSGPQWRRLEQFQCSNMYLTDLFQGGDEEVVTHNGQRVEHVHGLEERREGVKVRVRAEPLGGQATLCFKNILSSLIQQLILYTKSLQCLPPITRSPCPPPRSPSVPWMLPQGLCTCCSHCPEHVPSRSPCLSPPCT